MPPVRRLASDDIATRYRALRRLARRMLKSEVDVDDVLQDAWVAALEHESESVRNHDAWLTRVVQFTVLRHRRREAARRHHHTEAAREIAQHSAPAEAAAIDIEHALGRLPEPHAQVLRLRYLHGLTVPEVANAVGRPVNTVRSQLQRGLRRLRHELPEEPPRRRGLFGFWFRGTARPVHGLVLVALVAAVAPLLLTAFRPAVPEPLTQRSAVAAAATPGAMPVASEGGDTRVDDVIATEPLLTAFAPRLPTSAAIRGTVRTVSGRRLAGVPILSTLDPHSEDGATVIAHTDALGNFQAAAIDSRSWLSALCDDDYQSIWYAFPPSRGGVSEVDLRVHPPKGQYSGQVFGGDSLPIAATIAKHGTYPLRPSWTRGTCTVAPTPRHTRTDPDGRFATNRFRADVFVIRAPGHAPWVGRFEEEIRLRSSRALRGVIEHEGTAVAGARVTVEQQWPLPSLELETDGEGRFSTDLAGFGPIAIRAIDGSGNSVVRRGAHEDRDREWRLGLDRGATLRGQVAGVENAGDWRVRVWPLHSVAHQSLLDRPAGFSTDVVLAPDGSFVVAGCDPTPHVVALVPNGRPDTIVGWRIGVRPGDSVELRSAVATDTGTVHGDVSSPGVRVVLRESRTGYSIHRDTDADGRFTFERLLAGRYDVELWPPERGIQFVTTVDVGASQELDLGRLNVAARSRVEWMLQSTEGEPRPLPDDLKINVTSDRQSKGYTPRGHANPTVDTEAGRVIMNRVEPGRYHIRVSSNLGHHYGILVVDRGTYETEPIVLRPGHPHQATLRRAGPKPREILVEMTYHNVATGEVVESRRPDRPLCGKPTLVPYLPEGEYDAAIRTSDGWHGEYRVEVGPGLDPHVEVTLAPPWQPN